MNLSAALSSFCSGAGAFQNSIRVSVGTIPLLRRHLAARLLDDTVGFFSKASNGGFQLLVADLFRRFWLECGCHATWTFPQWVSIVGHTVYPIGQGTTNHFTLV